MNRELKLTVKNREIIKSLVYGLERKFEDVSFTLNEQGDSLLISFKSLGDDSELFFIEITQYANNFLEKFQRIDKKLKIEIIHREKAENFELKATNTFKSSLKKTEVPGAYWLDNELFKLYSLLDKAFLNFAVKLGAREVHAPSLIAESTLEKCGYLPKELHQVSFLYNKDSTGDVTNSHVCLSPAACLTTYPMFADKKIEQDSLVFTMLGNVFRHEGGRFSSEETPFERMWEYQVREIVFFGDSAFKEKNQSEYFEFLKKIGRALDFSFEIATAGDLFFHPEYTSVLTHQLLMKNKYELILTNHNNLALSSFNAHGEQFTKSFNISGNSESFQTFCIGFGIQRFMQGLMATHKDLTISINLIENFLKENP